MSTPHYLLNWDLQYHLLQLVTQPPAALLLLSSPFSIHRDPNGLSVSHSPDPCTHYYMNTEGHTSERLPSSKGGVSPTNTRSSLLCIGCTGSSSSHLTLWDNAS